MMKMTKGFWSYKKQYKFCFESMINSTLTPYGENNKGFVCPVEKNKNSTKNLF